MPTARCRTSLKSWTASRHLDRNLGDGAAEGRVVRPGDADIVAGEAGHVAVFLLGLPEDALPDAAVGFHEVGVEPFAEGFEDLDALGLDGEHRLDIVLMQLVKLTRNGEAVRMSKRTGKMISLSNLLDEIPVDAARYFFNSRPESAVEFDLDLAVRQDSENPVYYVQYAHARICTMLDNLANDGYMVPDIENTDLSLLTDAAELDLIKQLALLPEEIKNSARDLDPSRINRYDTELAARFHKFYTVCRIKDAPDQLRNARLFLADTVRKVLKIALEITGISAPENM